MQLHLNLFIKFIMLNTEITDLNSELSGYTSELCKKKEICIQNQINAKNQKSRSKNDIEIEEHLKSLNSIKQATNEIKRILQTKEKLLLDVKQYLIKFDTKMDNTLELISDYFQQTKLRMDVKTKKKSLDLFKADFYLQYGCILLVNFK